MQHVLLILVFVILCTSLSLAQEQGAKYELTKIEFHGNNTFSSPALKDLINSQETPMWVWKFLHSFTSLGKGPEYFDSTLIYSDTRSLNEYYIANGFFSVKTTYSYEVDSAKKQVVLTYNINEGHFSRIRQISLYGLRGLKDELQHEVEGLLPSDTTKRFSQSTLMASINSIITVLENNGFMTARYDSTLVIQDTVSNVANVMIYFDGGKEYSISKLLIKKDGPGAEKVEEDLLEQIVGIKEKELYSLEKIRLSQVRLFRTGLFNTVILAPVIKDTVGKTVPLALTGNIGLMNEFSPEIIMNNQQNSFNLGLAGVITRKNFLGGARKLTLSGSFGVSDIVRANPKNLVKTFSLQDTTVYGFYEGSARVEQPYVFGKPIFGTLEGYVKSNKDKSLNVRSIGGKISFEFELPRYTFINFLTAYYNFEVVDQTFPKNGKHPTLSQSISILGADMKAYKANDVIFPTKGFNLGLLIEEANLFNNVLSKLIGHDYNGLLFYKSTISSAFYIPATTRNNLRAYAVKLKVGYIQSYAGNEIDIPSVKKFTVGGSNSVRGWKARELAPSEDLVLSAIDSTVSIVGGTFLLEGGLEYRHKFTPEIGAVVFTDFGNTWLGYKIFRPDQVAVASGFGLRYYSAFAPFRVDFAVKSYDPNNRKNFFKKAFFKELFEFQIGIGEAF